MKITNLPTVINVATKTLQKKLLDIMSAIKVARKSIHQSLGSKKNVKVPRVINVPKIGGFLPIDNNLRMLWVCDHSDVHLSHVTINCT